MTCKECGREYTKKDVEDMLRAMFRARKWVDEDYEVQIYGLVHTVGLSITSI